MKNLKTILITLILSSFISTAYADSFSIKFPNNSQYYIKAEGKANVSTKTMDGAASIKLSFKDKKKKLFYIQYECDIHLNAMGNYDVGLNLITRQFTSTHPEYFGCSESDSLGDIEDYITPGFSADLTFRLKITSQDLKKGQLHMVGAFSFSEGPIKFNHREGFKLAGWS